MLTDLNAADLQVITGAQLLYMLRQDLDNKMADLQTSLMGLNARDAGFAVSYAKIQARHEFCAEFHRQINEILEDS